MTIYDNQFNSNEWFLIILTIIIFATLFLLPKRFSKQVTIVLLLFGVFVSYIFDLTIGLKPLDFYDVNDTSKYSIFDFITYVMFAPVSYIFFYFYDIFNIQKRYAPLYILGWSTVAMGMEWLAHYFGVYHYRMGYQFFYSFGIYLGVQAAGIILYLLLKNSYEQKNYSYRS